MTSQLHNAGFDRPFCEAFELRAAMDFEIVNAIADQESQRRRHPPV
ncbi:MULTISPECIES: hypothetical protein [Rhizobium/Agrobacterium group]|nr:MULTISPECIES: hypothetical protein [Rhizobium/Agrobacterium group]MDX8327341.1 hypothetical protein [Agrobacterium tumefaciens]